MRNLRSLLLVAVLASITGCFGGSSSPTGPGRTTPTPGPVGTLTAGGSADFGGDFEPDQAVIIEIGVARSIQWLSDDDRALAVFFNTTNLGVTKVGAITVEDAWDNDPPGIEFVDDVRVTADGDDWVVHFEGVSIPGALGTTTQLVLDGTLRSDIP